MWLVRVYDPEGFYEDYYFRKEENARAFLQTRVEEFIQLNEERGYDASYFGYDTYEEILEECVKHGRMTDVVYILKIETED